MASKKISDMTYPELIIERKRISQLMQTTKNIFTKKQNKSYLQKLERRIKEYELLRHRN